MKISGHDRRWLSPTRRSRLSIALLLVFGNAAMRRDRRTTGAVDPGHCDDQGFDGQQDAKHYTNLQLLNNGHFKPIRPG